MTELLKLGLLIAGCAQFALFLGSFAIPKKLNFKERTKDLEPLIRHLFYTYAIYILCSHLAFAIISFFLADDLLAGSHTGNALLTFMAVWWTGRLICQFFFFNRSGIPNTRFNKIAERLLVLMFFCLVTVYWGSLIHNLL